MRRFIAIMVIFMFTTGCGADQGGYLAAVRAQANDTEYNRLTEREWLLVGEDVCLKLEAGFDSPPDDWEHPSGVSWYTAWSAAEDHLC